MGLVIANNVPSLNAQHHLTRSSTSLAKSLERLSSGFKINRGADGPAALVISEKQRAQIAGLRKAIENSEKAISLVQTAEGALSEINSLLIKIRSLALDSANAGVNDDDALRANQSEIVNALDTINRIARNTQFGTRNLLDGSSGVTGTATDSDVTFLKATKDSMEGTYALEVTTPATRANTTATAQTSPLAQDEILTINSVNITLTANMTQADVIARINQFTSQTGVVAENAGGATRLYTVTFGSNAELRVSSNQPAASNSSGFGTTPISVLGTDIAGTIGGIPASGKGNVLTGTNGSIKGIAIQFQADSSDATQTVTGVQGSVTISDNSLVFQIGANAHQTASVAVSQATALALGVGVTGNRFANLSEINITSFDDAQDTIAIVDAAIDEITNMRGELGAFQQNTLESTSNSLRATLENSINADSVIRDTDFAAEIANYTKQQVLVQAGTSVLANANQSSQLVLALLR